MKKILVIAPNHQQFEFYTRKSPLFSYLVGPGQYIGSRGGYFIRVGEHWETKNIEKILDDLLARDFIEIIL